MNRDLIIGIVVSLVLHSGIIVFSHKASPPKHIAKPKDDIVEIVMPPIEEDKEDEVKDLNDEPPDTQMAAPTLVDIPTVVPVNAFTQPLTPPPPPGMTPSKGAITIPITRPGAGFGHGIKDLFNINDLDQKPIARVQPGPTYPYEMSRAGISGQVVVEFIINANGDVVETQVKSSSHREFEVPAMQAVQKWKFKPGKKGGKAVSTRVSQLIEFNLEDSK